MKHLFKIGDIVEVIKGEYTHHYPSYPMFVRSQHGDPSRGHYTIGVGDDNIWYIPGIYLKKHNMKKFDLQKAIENGAVDNTGRKYKYLSSLRNRHIWMAYKGDVMQEYIILTESNGAAWVYDHSIELRTPHYDLKNITV